MYRSQQERDALSYASCNLICDYSLLLIIISSYVVELCNYRQTGISTSPTQDSSDNAFAMPGKTDSIKETLA